jgi:hypothetical protein
VACCRVTFPYSCYEFGSGVRTDSVFHVFYTPGAKRPGCEVDRSPLSSAEGKYKWDYTSVCPIYLHDMDRDSFTYTLFCFGHKVV